MLFGLQLEGPHASARGLAHMMNNCCLPTAGFLKASHHQTLLVWPCKVPCVQMLIECISEGAWSGLVGSTVPNM